MNPESAKRMLFFYEKIDIPRLRRDYRIPDVIDIGLRNMSGKFYGWRGTGLADYISEVTGSMTIRGKTCTDLLIEQGHEPREVTLWAQAFDCEGERIKWDYTAYIPISKMTNNHLRNCIRIFDGKESVQKDINLMKQELKCRGKG